MKRRNERFVIMLNQAELDLLERLADKLERSKSDTMRYAMRRLAEQQDLELETSAGG